MNVMSSGEGENPREDQQEVIDLQSFRSPVVVDSLITLLEEAEAKHGLSSNTTVFGIEGELYFKACTRPLLREDQRVLYISRVSFSEEYRSQGLFTNLLKQAERCAAAYRYGLLVESVTHPRLEKFLLRQGYREMDFSTPPSFFKTKYALFEEYADLRRRILMGDL